MPDDQGLPVMLLGVLGLFACGLGPSIIWCGLGFGFAAIVLGTWNLGWIEVRRMAPPSERSTRIGRNLGILSCVLSTPFFNDLALYL